VVDDYQLCAMIPLVKKLNPKAVIIYRSHIQYDTELINSPSSIQHETWTWLYENFLQHAHLFIFHPVPSFVPDGIPNSKIEFMPATMDPLDGLNKPMQQEHMEYWRRVFDRILIDHNVKGRLKRDCKYFIQIARFDPSKGIPDVIESYKKFRQLIQNGEDAPQLVICGHGSVDDPEATEVYNRTISILETDVELKEYVEDICVARLPPCDQLLNVLLRMSWIALQLSIREGFEIKVSEAISKGIPVIAYNTGGIVNQIKHEQTGILIPVGDTSLVADWMYKLWNNHQLREKMSENAVKDPDVKNFVTVCNTANWLRIAKRHCTL